MSHFVHYVPGRLRIKVPALRNHAGRCQRVRALLCDHSGIEDVIVNAVTGSVVIHYDTDLIDETRLFNLLRYHGLYNDAQVQRIGRQRNHKAGEAVGRAMFNWMVGRALEANGLGLLAAFI